MDFIERWFGVSPDNGSGATELLWLLVVVAAVVVTFYLRRRGLVRKTDSSN